MKSSKVFDKRSNAWPANWSGYKPLTPANRQKVRPTSSTIIHRTVTKRNAVQPSPSNEVHKAEERLERAAQQLAERRQQAEFDLALEIVRRFQSELGEMVKRQQRVIKKTVELDAGRQPATPLPLVTSQGCGGSCRRGTETGTVGKRA